MLDCLLLNFCKVKEIHSYENYGVKDYDKNSSDPKLVLENLKLKNNNRLVIGYLNINSISNKFDNLKD